MLKLHNLYKVYRTEEVETVEESSFQVFAAPVTTADEMSFAYRALLSRSPAAASCWRIAFSATISCSFSLFWEQNVHLQSSMVRDCQSCRKSTLTRVLRLLASTPTLRTA